MDNMKNKIELSAEDVVTIRDCNEFSDAVYFVMQKYHCDYEDALEAIDDGLAVAAAEEAVDLAA